jgi:protein-arginine kinase activator protein McsA
VPNLELQAGQSEFTITELPDQIIPRIFYCRLCAKPRNESDTVDIDKQETKILNFLSSFLGSWSEQDDTLHKSICRVCACKLNETIQFQTECIQAAAKLQSQCSDSIPNTSEIESFGKFEFISTFTDWPNEVTNVKNINFYTFLL